ncbi:MAG: glycerophosphodiester phosphodiesterase [Propionibacteriales bacterium]|nr:glycerophosphodiester phosphodiesterase [Propionibacteriales bacterium]
MRARRAADYPYFDNGGLPIAFAHRGGATSEAGKAIENSMTAFQQAVALGYRYLETDVHATKDGILLAFHDRSLDRSTGVRGVLADVTYDDVRELRIGRTEPISLFEEVLTSWPDVCINIDAKSAAVIRPLARLISAHAAWDRVCVASFSSRRLHDLRRALGPRVATSYGAVGIAALRLLPIEDLRRWFLLGGAVVAQVPVRRGRLEIVTEGFVDRAHDLGKHVHVWTVDQPDEMNRLLDRGVDAIMADRIDVLREVYRARGIWRG